MARTIEQLLTALRAAKLDTPAGVTISLETLRSVKPAIGVAIAALAKRVAAEQVEVLALELPDAFGRLLVDGVKRDPGCRGKIAIARALHELDRWDDRVFVAGLRVVQDEGIPPPEDTAAELRGVCALAHAHFARANVLDVLAELLADPERTVRIAAARAIGDAGRPDAAALLRYKLVAATDEPEVLGECFESMLALDRAASTAFAIAMLDRADDRGEAAALALGGARIADAREALLAWCDAQRPEPRQRVGYLALALLRDDAANAYLLEAIRTAARADAVAAARALATFKETGNIAEALRAAARAVEDATTRREIEALLAR